MNRLKLLLLTISMTLGCGSAMALNDLVLKLEPAFKQGDFYSAFITVPQIRGEIKNSGYAVFTEMDEAMCNYYEALNSQFLYENVENKEEKLAHNAKHFGEDHYTTLTMKAIYSKKQPDGLETSREAMEATEAELGKDSWQYAALRYLYIDVLEENGKMEEAYKVAVEGTRSLKGTDLERGWLDGCLTIMQSAVLSNLQRFGEMETPFNEAANIYINRNNLIAQDILTGLASTSQCHLGYYIACVARALGFNKDAIETTEYLLNYMDQFGMGNTGLAMEMKSNIAIAYFKEKNYKKSRPAMQEYLRYLEKKGEKGSLMYNYIDNMLKQTPK